MAEVLTPRSLPLGLRYPEEPELRNALGQMLSQEAEAIFRAFGPFVDGDKLERAVSTAQFLSDEEYRERYISGYLNALEMVLGQRARRIIETFKPWLEEQALSESSAALVGGRPYFRLEVLARSNKEQAEQTMRHELNHKLSHQKKVRRPRWREILVRGGVCEHKIGYPGVEGEEDVVYVIENSFLYETITELLGAKVYNPDFEMRWSFARMVPPLATDVLGVTHLQGKYYLDEPHVLERLYFRGEIGPFKKAINHLLRDNRAFDEMMATLNDVQFCTLGIKEGKSFDQLDRDLIHFWYSRMGLTEEEINRKFGFL
jgi:hypothetical protein